MKSSVLLLAIAAVAFGSCSTVYKSGQTPDDVYYSPARETEEVVEVKKDQYSSRGYEYDNPDDRYLRMKVRNPYRWNSFDDYYYNDWAYTNSYGYNSYNPFYSWNTYWSWNSYYNPYCHKIVVVNPKSSPTVYNKVRNFSMGSYVNNNTTKTSSKSGVRPTSRYNNSNYNNSNSSNNSLGTSIRKVFSGGNSNSNSGGSYSTSSSNDRPTRTYNPSSTSSSSGSSGSSGGSKSGGGSSGGGVSRPGRGG